MRTLLLITTALALAACADMGSGRSLGSGGINSPSASAPVRSSEVGDAQQRLRTVGYYDGPVDGIWGPETQAAVLRFQRNRGLEATGRLDGQTADILRSDAAAISSAAATPIAISDPTDVRTLQNRLRQLGVYGGPADGVWGPDTQAAVETFQRSHGLAVGQLNGLTISAMGLDPRSFPGRRAVVPATPIASAAVPNGPLDPSVVRGVQQRLRQGGFYRGAVDGIWGGRTEAALESFQKSRGLEASGDLNPATAQALGLDPNNLSSGAIPRPIRSTRR
jgi:peptidoglycan hydrolase-like protein with peptidoglycan-binding domain